MKKETSAVIGIAAVLLILCSAFCGAAAADGGNVAKIGTAEYATVVEAVNAAQPGDTIEMIADSAEPMITIDKEIILNLAGHVLRNSETGSVLLIPEPGNLTIIDEKAVDTPADTPHYFTFVKAGPWKLETTAPAAGTTVDLADFDRAAAEAAPADSYHIKVTGGVIAGGSGSGHGGAVNIFRGTFTLSGGNLVGNTADSGGGAVYVGSDISTFTMNNGTIAGNWTPNGGGAVYVAVESRFIMTGGKIIGNAAGTVGGAVNIPDGTFEVSGGSITQNSAGTTGGAVSVGDTSLFVMNGGRISGNTAAYGGGADIYHGTFVMKGGYIEENCAKTEAGGICVVGGTFIMEGGYITKNHAKYCGGVYVHSNGMFTMEDGHITENSAEDGGGGVLVHTDASFSMNGGTITQNSAKYGGGVFVDAGSFTLFGGTIAENSAEFGGGVYAHNNSPLLMSKGTITRNTVSGDGAVGAGVCIMDAQFTMEGGSITENYGIGDVTAGGGVGIFQGCTFVMDGGSITKNRVGDIGGGICVLSESDEQQSGVKVTEEGSGETVVLLISGTAVVSDNTAGAAENNLCLDNKTSLVLNGGFTGSVGISYAEGTPAAGESFGIVSGSAAESDAKHFAADGNSRLVGKISDGLLVWTEKAAPTANSPMPLAGLLAGLGAAALVFGLGRR